MNHLFRSLILLFVFSALLPACDKEKEGVPSYLHITKFSFTTTAGQGLNTYDIPSAKVFVNGMEMGNFELPVTFPVIAEGDAKVEVFPNVKENGLSNSQKYYKPYNSYITQVSLNKREVDTVRPSTTYRSTTTQFKFMEDFEDQGLSLERSGNNNSSDSLVILPTSTPGVDQPFNNSDYCGFVKVTSDSFVVFERNSTGNFKLPNMGRDNYVELDIKSNVNLQIGLYIQDGAFWVPVPVMVAFPTNGKWKKIYVNLKSETNDMPLDTLYRLFFGFYSDNSEDKFVYIDNIKVLYVE